MGSMSSLYLGVSGLSNSQIALNVTAQNLANVDTNGYVRQQVLAEDSKYQTLKDTYTSLMQTGLGTSIDMIRQVRDVFLDKSYRQELGREGFYEAQYETVQEIEGLFGELEGVAFQDSLENMWTSIQELAKEPDSIVNRAALIQNSITFIERSQNIAKQLQEYQVNLNTQIIDKVDRINEIGDEIFELNKKVRQYESTGIEHANDYRDKRNALIDELGQMVKINYKENADGIVTISAEGTPFVTEFTVYEMATAKISDESNMLKPIWKGTNVDVFDLTVATSTQNNSDIGSLKGLLVSRGDATANYLDIPIAPKQADFATPADYDLALVQYETEVDEYDIQIASSVIMSTQAKFDQLIHGIVTAINDILAPNKELTLTDGSTIMVLDEENAPVGMDENNTMGEALFNRKSVERYTQETVNVFAADGVTIVPTTVMRYNEEIPGDEYTLFSLGEIEVNPAVMKNYSLIPLSSNSGSGDYDIEVCDALTAAWREKFAALGPDTLTKNNFIDYYTSFIGEIANRGNVLKSITASQGAMVENIDNQRMAVTGVSSDDELTNMIKFQHAYNAAARYVNVIDEMLEHIVTRL